MLNKLCIIIMLCVGIYHTTKMLSTNEETCAEMSQKPPVIKFVNNENELIYDYNVSKDRLLGIKNKHERSLSRFVVGGATIGLTLGRYSYQISLSSGFKKIGFGGNAYCPSLRNVDVEFNYDSKVFVAKEYTQNKCAFDIILNHELDHHQVNVTNKQKYLGWLEKDLPTVVHKIIKEYKPVSKDKLQLTANQIQADIENAIDAYIYKMHLDTSVQNKKLDTPSEYRRLNNEIRRCY